jgi:hypothetical protein
MIESAYWKTELLPIADDIELRCHPARWTEKRAVLLEREIMLAMFSVRSLIERHKLSDALIHKPVSVTAYPKKTQKPVTLLNSHQVDELYDFDRAATRTVALEFLCNQIIHSYIIFPARDETRAFSHVFVCSDYERNRHLYSVPIDTIIALLREVGMDYPNHMHLEYDPKIQDYRITQTHVA